MANIFLDDPVKVRYVGRSFNLGYEVNFLTGERKIYGFKNQEIVDLIWYEQSRSYGLLQPFAKIRSFTGFEFEVPLHVLQNL